VTPDEVLDVLRRIGVMKLSGRHSSGKTLFSIKSPIQPVLVLDTEYGSVSYEGQFPFTRMEIVSLDDLRVVLGAIPPTQDCTSRGVRPIDNHEFETIVLDTTAPVVEDWLTDEINNTGGGMVLSNGRLSPLGWGALKKRERELILRLKRKCTLAILTTHMRMEFVGRRPTGRYQPKGKEVLDELSSLGLILERNPNNRLPSATLEKMRLITPQGEPLLPPRIPECTWENIAAYVMRPPNWDSLSDTEKAEARHSIMELLQLMSEAGVDEEEPDIEA